MSGLKRLLYYNKYPLPSSRIFYHSHIKELQNVLGTSTLYTGNFGFPKFQSLHFKRSLNPVKDFRKGGFLGLPLTGESSSLFRVLTGGDIEALQNPLFLTTCGRKNSPREEMGVHTKGGTI